ncbi:hypothetical protein CAEBREN_22873 [Caenorhabditis brenneri]|uniref:BTB domain-containing protein n=1 Tax=Caenorhabditis brenneri TaxID=135651 RepID=G0P1A4_CAEBE|nr:hypothetical protein CAEBREN_22873 [Caenorhabditis brenneri]
MSIIGKKFLLEHCFQEINSMEEQEMVMGPIEEHLGIPWQLSVKRNEGHLNVVVNCNLPKDNKTWSINTEVKGELVSSKGGIIVKNFRPAYTSTGDTNTGDAFLSWESLENDYLIDGSFHIYVEVKIKKGSGLPKKKLIHFDSPEPNVIQGLLIVEGEKFYVDRMFLASKSTEFNKLFFGKEENLENNEFQLNDVRVSDFQNFLEDVYHAKVIDGNENLVFFCYKQKSF